MRRGVLGVLPCLVCLLGACFDRKPGTDRVPVADAGTAVELRLVQPAHGAVVMRRRPVVRWRASVASPAWRVEFCADIRCERVLQSVSTADTTTAASGDLPTGLVFWRVLDPTRVGVASTMRWFHVPRGAPAGAPPGYGAVLSWAQYDANADGRAEFLDVDGTLRPGDSLEPVTEVIARIARNGAERVIAAGDVDGDGFPDLAGVVKTPTRDNLTVLVWRGPIEGAAVEPSWRIPVLEPMPDGGAPERLDLLGGDVNGDGYGDLVVSSLGFQQQRGQVYVVPGGARAPTAADVVALSSPRGILGQFRALAVADLDGDGYDDLLAAAPGLAGLSAVYRGTARGLDPLPPWSIARTHGNDHLGSAGAIADLTGDGAPDVALSAPRARALGCVYAFPWRPTAGLLPSDPSAAACGAGVRPSPTLGEAIGLGDFDGDGRADLVALETDVTTDRLWTTPGHREGFYEGGLTPLERRGSAPFYARHLTAVELDGDGYADLVVETLREGIPDAILRFRGTPAGLVPWPSH